VVTTSLAASVLNLLCVVHKRPDESNIYASGTVFSSVMELNLSLVQFVEMIVHFLKQGGKYPLCC
jgi:hypothetical protein